MITAEDAKFLESGQEALRLKIALERFFVVEDASMKKKYAAYLRMRIRPAMEQLIKQGAAGKIAVLLTHDWLNLWNLDLCIDLAAQQRQTEILAMLLGKKRETYGFEKLR